MKSENPNEHARREVTLPERTRLKMMFDEAPWAACILRGPDLPIENVMPDEDGFSLMRRVRGLPAVQRHLGKPANAGELTRAVAALRPS